MYDQKSKLVVVTFCWGPVFNYQHVLALKNAVASNLSVPHRFVCITDQEMPGIETVPLWRSTVSVRGRPDNFRRLKLFSAEAHSLLDADRLVQIDLDAVILNDLTPLVTCKEPFRIMEGTAERHHQVNYYNGSIWVHDAGARESFWADLNAMSVGDLENLRMPDGRKCIGSDQAWIARCSKTEAVFRERDGVYQYRRLPKFIDPGTRAVFFAGRSNPWDNQVAQASPRLFSVWCAYATGKVRPHQSRFGKCLIIGMGPSVWDEVRAAFGEDKYDGIIAFPEAAEKLVSVDALALTFKDAVSKAKRLGFTETKQCGHEYVDPRKMVRTSRGSMDFV